MYSVRFVSPYSYLVISSDILAFEVEQDASEGIDEKLGGLGLFPPFDEEDLAWFFVLRALKRNFSIFFDI